MQSNTSANRMSVSDRYRIKISEANIVDRLIKHYHNQLSIPLDNGQIMLGLKLINKILPDLQSVTVDVSVEHKQLTKLELEQRLLMLGRDPQVIWNQLNPNIIESVAVPVRESEETEPDE